ncbi:SMI1/KNR4 family protein [Clostridium manihotivorum]|uniref:Knr4/Smi1-like domain-containing protein n=1 Tax=Clostridium manihotivorum TaxID=2320868 RepID=A0A3R5TID2_9CLOT|nr:SMI1/KNR4 family protein [Clostridium manihotivorum]QAA34160.1 hypothetical protein C1I91_22405 [Clostridium manihotivorum]
MNEKFKWDINVKNSEDIIKKIESNFNIKFPEKYIQAVTQHDGGMLKVRDKIGLWKTAIINIENWHGKNAVVALLSYDNNSNIENTKVIKFYNVFKDSLPEPKIIIPFAIDGAGNLFFFDYRKNINEPSIVFLDHETAYTEEDFTEEEIEQKTLNELLNDNLYYVCDSFDELLNMITPCE